MCVCVCVCVYVMRLCMRFNYVNEITYKLFKYIIAM